MLIILAPKLMSHVCALLIDNVGNYLYLNNGRFKFEVDPHQFNLRLHHFSQFQRIKKIQKLAGLWLAGEIVDHIGIYGSKVAEGLSAFQRRSCLLSWCNSGLISMSLSITWHFIFNTLCLHHCFVKKGSLFLVCSTSQLASCIVLPVMVANMVSRQILKQSMQHK